jgi:hypothetical protein
MSRSNLVLPILALCASVMSIDAQTLPIPASGRYTVQVGDTLESIAQKFLGSSNRWSEIVSANPDIKNPHFITPGTEIRIVAGRSVAAKRATIEQVFRQVEQMPFPRPWTPASVGGVLQERDGIRTFEKSSSELKFDNQTRMVLSEESMVFLREAPPTPENVSRKSIEIRAGQADLDVRGGSPTDNGIEFHIGGTVGTTRPGSALKGESRARRAADGGSRVMVYGGEGEISASGRSVAVPSGMGIAVASDGRTNGPERLLTAPKALSPNESQSFDYSNPTFDWEPVANAQSYTVEVCRDTGCGQLVDRASGIRMSRWTPRVLPIGDLYWRVNAVSPSGLDGYMSAPLRFTIRTFWRRPVDNTQ